MQRFSIRPNLVALGFLGVLLSCCGASAWLGVGARTVRAIAQEPESPPRGKPALEKPSGEKPSGEKKSAEKPPATKKSAPKSPGKRPASKSPAAADGGRAAVDAKLLEFTRPSEPQEGDDELTKKLKERHDVAAELLAARIEEYRRNVGTLSGVLEAARTVLEAKLELSADKEARAAVLDQALDVARALEKHYESLDAEGLGARSDRLRAKLARVSVETQILKLRGEP